MFTPSFRRRSDVGVTRVAAPLLALCCSLAFSGATLANEGHVGMLRNVTGDINVARAGGVLDGASGMKLFVSDRVVSGDAASATIVFKDATLLTVGSSVDVEVKQYVFEPKRDKFDFMLYIAKGAAVYTSGLMGKLSPESVKVATPIATIGIRGTRFIVDAGSGQQ